MNCPFCETELKYIKQKEFMYVDKTPIPYLVNLGDQVPIHKDIYVCIKCGWIHQFVPESELKYLENL